jgi:hypothetical protein
MTAFLNIDAVNQRVEIGATCIENACNEVQ